MKPKSIPQIVAECIDHAQVSIREIVAAAREAGYGGRELVSVAQEVHRRMWTQIGGSQGVRLSDDADCVARFERLVSELAA